MSLDIAILLALRAAVKNDPIVGIRQRAPWCRQAQTGMFVRSLVRPSTQHWTAKRIPQGLAILRMRPVGYDELIRKLRGQMLDPIAIPYLCQRRPRVGRQPTLRAHDEPTDVLWDLAIKIAPS